MRAYAIGCIDTTDGRFLGVGLFSESTPTLGAKRFVFTIAEADGDTWDQARELLEYTLSDRLYAWTQRFLVPRDGKIPSRSPDYLAGLEAAAKVADEGERRALRRGSSDGARTALDIAAEIRKLKEKP